MIPVAGHGTIHWHPQFILNRQWYAGDNTLRRRCGTLGVCFLQELCSTSSAMVSRCLSRATPPGVTIALATKSLASVQSCLQVFCSSRSPALSGQKQEHPKNGKETRGQSNLRTRNSASRQARSTERRKKFFSACRPAL